MMIKYIKPPTSQSFQNFVPLCIMVVRSHVIPQPHQPPSRPADWSEQHWCPAQDLPGPLQSSPVLSSPGCQPDGLTQITPSYWEAEIISVSPPPCISQHLSTSPSITHTSALLHKPEIENQHPDWKAPKHLKIQWKISNPRLDFFC